MTSHIPDRINQLRTRGVRPRIDLDLPASAPAAYCAVL
jgi:hypothetical protein